MTLGLRRRQYSIEMYGRNMAALEEAIQPKVYDSTASNVRATMTRP